MIGGGDFNYIPESMYETRQLVWKQQNNCYELEERAKMQYPRHGHAACALGSNFIVATGSRKDNSKASQRTELYNIQSNSWREMGLLIQGRHYHSSCSFNNEYVYVFCGISNVNKKYLATIERLNVGNVIKGLQANWEMVSFS